VLMAGHLRLATPERRQADHRAGADVGSAWPTRKVGRMRGRKAPQRIRLIGSAFVATAVLFGQIPAVAAPTPALAADTRTSNEVQSPGRLGPLTDLVIQRLLVSDQVAASKFGTSSPIDDPVREQQELTTVKRAALAMGLDAAATVQFFQAQITASKIVQRGLFQRWTAHPDLAPTSRPSLNAIRTQLDQITTGVLQQLKATQGFREKARPCTIALTLAQRSGEERNHLDTVHRQALSAALQSTCSRA
jgi:chorismate mutase-like protein